MSSVIKTDVPGIVSIAAIIATYSMGPNVVVGLSGAAICGTLSLVYKVKQLWLGNQNESYLHYQQSSEEYYEYTRKFTISAIPVAGPWLIFLPK